MDNQLDSTIRRLSRGLKNARLAEIESAVFARIAQVKEARAHRWRSDLLSFLGALAVGVGAAATIAAPTTASPVVSLGEVSRLAPSSLLEHGR